MGPVQFQDHGQPGWGLPTQPVFSRSREGSTEGENENAGRQTQELVRSGNRRKESHQSNTQPPQAFPECKHAQIRQTNALNGGGGGGLRETWLKLLKKVRNILRKMSDR